MSELEPRSGEHQVPHQEIGAKPEHHKPNSSEIASAEKRQKEVVQEMQELSEALAKSSEDLQVQQKGESKPQSHSFGVHNELRLENYRRLLGRVQARLKGPEKGFSKVIHNKQVDALSSVGANTVARPIGLLTGGLAAFVGSLIVLLFARHYGFRYNFSLFLLLFIGGYLAGTVIEALVKSFQRLRK